jgi:hypothetical protein
MKTLKSKKVLGGIALVMVCLNPAQASTTWGASDCGEWVNQSKVSPSMRTWLYGFMTGLGAMNELNGSKDDPLKKLNSADQITVWMDNFCQKNPLKTVAGGGVTLFYELQKK